MDNPGELRELLLPEPARSLGALLGVPVPDLDGGEGLPLLWHWVYLLDRPALADLGPDGAPLRGSVTAFPSGGRRRMWAGGRVHARGPLRCWELATRDSRVLSVEEKRGRSGLLTFISVQHQIRQRGHVIITEQQTIVYREAAVSGAGQPPDAFGADQVVPAAADEWTIEVSPPLLFRFSALTYNAHRIHYDRDYATRVQGYPGLLVQGPLQALVMAEAARAAVDRAGWPARRLEFEYRLHSPLFDFQGMVVGAVREREAVATAVRSLNGRQTAGGSLANGG